MRGGVEGVLRVKMLSTVIQMRRHGARIYIFSRFHPAVSQLSTPAQKLEGWGGGGGGGGGWAAEH